MTAPRHRMPALALVLVVTLAVAGCGPSAETVDVDVVVEPIAIADAPVDSGTIRTGMSELLADLAVLEPGVTPLVSDMVESEAALGAQLREPPVPVALGSRRGLSRGEFDSFGAGLVLVGGLIVVGLGAMTKSSDVSDLAVAGSTSKTGSGTKASSVSRGSLTIERTATNDLSLSIEQKSESSVGGVSVTSNNKVKIEGTVCPSDDGRFDFTVTMSSDAAGGPGESKAAASQTLTVRVTGELDDNGQPGEMKVEGHQSTRHIKPDGSAVYVETKNSATGNIVSAMAGIQASKPEFVRGSSNATNADVREIAKLAAERLSYLTLGAISGVASTMWNGGCVRIDAKSPGTVESYEKSTIPVKTLSILSGEEFSSRVDLSLSGAESVDKTTLRTAESFEHEAGGYGTSGIIKLEAKSKRGTAKLTLDIKVAGGAYSADGGGGAFHGTGVICDISKPFTIAGSGVTVEFTPTSATGGTYSYSGAIDGVTVYGGESYSVDYLGDVATTIKGWGVGTIEAEGYSSSGYGEEVYALTALENSPSECG